MGASDLLAPAAGRLPTGKPPFTLADIKRVIPPHCFQRSAVRSFSYLLRDVAVAVVLLYLAVAVIPALPCAPLRLLAWPLYWAAQGCALGGLWVIAHECGHHAFSENTALDDAVGFALHTALLVPYFSWKLSHRRHHSNSGSLERDEVFVPRRRKRADDGHPYARTRLATLAALVIQLVLGWPLYLACNAAGRPYPRFTSHYVPTSLIFTGRRERALVVLSDAGVLAASLALCRLATAHGLWAVARAYGAPLVVLNAWLVLVTYLQHTDPTVPRYGGGGWDWLRGALATVDRDYGALLNAAFHNITDTHVVHHLFPTLPHYHAAEATRAIRPVLGEYYRFDATPVAKAAWRAARECIYVEPDAHRDGVFWYGN